jgi:hypothetical protein
MIICPIAIAVGCNKCAVVSICPLKAAIGNYKPPMPPAAVQALQMTKSPRSKTRSKRARTRRPRKR